jgi:hypothetical protein
MSFIIENVNKIIKKHWFLTYFLVYYIRN